MPTPLMPGAPTATDSLRLLLEYIEQHQMADIPAVGARPALRSADLEYLIERANTVLADERAPDVSPFLRYRDIIRGHYGTAMWLSDLVLHLWNSRDHEVYLNRIQGFDPRHRDIALELIAHYAQHGENDVEFMKLAREIADDHEGDEQRLAEIESHG